MHKSVASPKERKLFLNDNNINQQITHLKEEITFLKHQYKQLLQFIKEDRETINQLKDKLEKTPSNQNQTTLPSQTLRKLSKHFQIKDIHSSQILALIELKDKRIVTGSKDGSICISKINYDKKDWNIQTQVNNAHNDKIHSFCELIKKRFVSCGEDKLIKIWDYSTPSTLTNIHNIQGHTGGIVKVITLSEDRIASCSYNDDTVRIWESEFPFNLKQTFQQQRYALSIIQLKKRYEIICISCTYGSGCLCFYDLVAPYQKRGTIEEVNTNLPGGLLELSNGDVAVSKGAYPVPCIYIVDPVRYVKVTEFVDEECIVDCGPLCSWGNNSFIYVVNNFLCVISLVDEEYKIVFKEHKQKEQLNSVNSVVNVTKGKYLVNNNFTGLNILSYS